MTLTPEQLDEIERAAHDELRVGDFATCVLVQPETVIHLVSVYRAALAWSEARLVPGMAAEREAAHALIAALRGTP